MTPKWIFKERLSKDKKIVKNLVAGSYGVLCYNLMSFQNDIIDDQFIQILEETNRAYGSISNPWIDMLLDCAKKEMTLKMRLNVMDQEELLTLNIAKEQFSEVYLEQNRHLTNWLVQRFNPISEWIRTLQPTITATSPS
jgi:hypothetical protein